MSTNNPTPDVSSHSNVVTITDESNTITSILFGGFLVVSDGQPHDPAPTISRNGNVFTIDLEAGRQKTAPVAEKFNLLSGGADNEYAPFKEFDNTPEELNFFFSVQIHFEFEGVPSFVNVYLAQGSVGSTNNWWIGSPAVSNVDGEPQLIYTADLHDVVLGLSGTHDSFNLRQVDVRKNSPIQHVFVLMLENHSFDNMLAMSGIPGLFAATTANSNSYQDQTYNVTEPALSVMPAGPGHEFTDVLEQLCGPGVTYNGGKYPTINNSGFVANYATTDTEPLHAKPSEFGDVMACFDSQSQLPILYELASQFAVCDQWFSSLPGPTWPNRFFVHGASSNGLDHSPSGEDIVKWELPGSGGFSLPHGSIYDEIRTNEIAFGLFIDKDGPLEGGIAQVAALHNLSMLNVHSLTDFVSFLQTGKYQSVYTFIEPNYGDVTSTYDNGSSQHPIDGVGHGEQLIKTVYEAIRNSNIWERSMLIITYDEHGGFYDHYPPPPAPPPNDGSDSSGFDNSGFLFDQLGVRVPAVIISPWIQPQVDHTVYDHTSVLRTVEKLYGLNPLTERDKKANDVLHLVGDVLRTNCPTQLSRPAPEPVRPPITAAQQMVLDQQPLPPAGNHYGFLAIAVKTDMELAEGNPAEQAAILAKAQAIKTRGEARAYLQSVVKKVDAAKMVAA